MNYYGDPYAVEYDSGRGEIFAVSPGYYGDSTAEVDVLSGSSDQIVATIPLAGYPNGAAYDSGKGEVFVTNLLGSDVSVISDTTNAVVATIPVGSHPIGAAYDSRTGEIFVANEDSNTVSVISDASNSVVATIPVGYSPVGAAYDSVASAVFVANSGSSNVSVICDNGLHCGMRLGVVKSISVGASPGGVTFDPTQDEIFVTNGQSDTVSVISDTWVVAATITVGLFPMRATYDSATEDVLVANEGSITQAGSVSVISAASNSVVATIPAGVDSLPSGVAYDSGQNEIFLADYGLFAMIGVIAWTTLYTVTITESGLPSGTSWTAPIQPLQGNPWSSWTRGSSNGPSISYTLINGSYDWYAFDSLANFEANDANLPPVTVSGSGVSLGVAFEEVYNITFSETGLPGAAWWGVTLPLFEYGEYTEYTGSTNTSAMTLADAEVNGSYAYTMVAANRSWGAPGGFVKINGAAASVTVPFSILRYTVTFAETGIPAKTLKKAGWTVELNGTQLWSNSTVITFSGIPNGTYAVLIRGPAGYDVSESGTQIVSGTTAATETFTKGKTVTLTFHEKGLPKSGGKVQSWCVVVDGDLQCSTAASTKYVDLPPGSYSYAVVSPLSGQNITATIGKTAIPTSGVLLLTGSESVTLTFSYWYQLMFTQTGLTSGSWSVTVKGQMLSASWYSPIYFYVVNGTYGYKIGTTASGYTWSGSPTKATINGAPASVAVKFTAKKGKVPAGLPEVTFGGVAPAVVVLGCWSGLGVGHSER